jgi:MFS family permease
VWKQWHCLKPAVVCRPEIRWQIHHDVVGSQLPCVLSSPLCREDLDLGQLIIGQLPDAVGRRWPLLLALGWHAVMSVLCALARTIAVLAVTPTLQGVADGAVAVGAMATMRDMFSGTAPSSCCLACFWFWELPQILVPFAGDACKALGRV